MRTARVCLAGLVGLTTAAAALGACGPSLVRLGDDEPDGSTSSEASSLDRAEPLDSGTPARGEAGDTGFEAAALACPSAAPTAGASCAPLGRVCEYGDDPTPACNRTATCTASGWTFGPPACAAQACASACPSGSCPAGFLGASSPTAAAVCTASGLVCAFPQGTCACGSRATTATGPDGGLHWKCVTTAAGCPNPRPDLGTPCTGTMTCDYGACSGGITVVCSAGVWQPVSVSCP